MHRYRSGKAIVEIESESRAGGSRCYRGTVTVPSAILLVGADAECTTRNLVWPFLLKLNHPGEEMNMEDVAFWALEYGRSLNGKVPRNPTIEQAASIEEAVETGSDGQLVLERISA